MNSSQLLMTNGLLLTLIAIETLKISPSLSWIIYVLLIMIAVSFILDLYYDNRNFMRLFCRSEKAKQKR